MSSRTALLTVIMDPALVYIFRAIRSQCSHGLQLGDTLLTDAAKQMEKEKIWEKVRQADTSKLVPGLNETELIQQLVSLSSVPLSRG